MVDSDSWEALDVDDSDLQSLIKPSPPPQPILLPCKRSSTHQTLQTPNSQSHTPLLSPSSQLSHQSLQPLQGLASTSSAEHRRIPGPAGALQAVMQRRALAKRNEGFREEEISTHDYIKRVQEIEDEDFKLNPWLCAMEFVGRIGGFANSPLNSIKGSSMGTDRLDQVVAVVKSCAPNGFGDLIVTLKDPTGTVGASIHRNVVTGSDFGKDISVGCVLILQKVVVFSTSRSAHNLNVTLRNVVKVVGKDSGPPTRHNLASIIRGVRSDTEHVEKRASVVGRVSADEIVNRMVREKMKGKAVVDVDRQMEDCSRGGEEEMVNAEDHNMQTLMDKLEDNAEIGAKAGSVGRDNNIEEETANNIAQRSIIPEDDFNSNISSSRYQLTSAAVKSQSRERESVRTTASMKERQHLISKATLPAWTDEQLDELFAASFDDE
ncbi:hypothetical protein Scep_022892 [Stephania cephalantha]|uniref:Homologous recombination OB-fold protein OB-fold domain-containing protein n=1 Tax=Stephania cephalantha TaxID=152367 RepID=A0AAP0HY78_9MAGN